MVSFLGVGAILVAAVVLSTPVALDTDGTETLAEVAAAVLDATAAL